MKIRPVGSVASVYAGQLGVRVPVTAVDAV